MSLILTLQLDLASQAYFELLRQLHFPPERNQIPAHLTLFHNLPHASEILATLDQTSASYQPFELTTTGLRNLGKGVAYTLSSPMLNSLHQTLASAFQQHLIPQDMQPFRPHIVVQNKATPAQAQTLLTQLNQSFTPSTHQALGLDLWTYLNGPWQHTRTFAFSSPPQS